MIGRVVDGSGIHPQALLRLMEPSAGRLEIDGVDVARIGLHDLRRSLAIVPQDPFLFSGTVRKPFVFGDGYLVRLALPWLHKRLIPSPYPTHSTAAAKPGPPGQTRRRRPLVRLALRAAGRRREDLGPRCRVHHQGPAQQHPPQRHLPLEALRPRLWVGRTGRLLRALWTQLGAGAQCHWSGQQRQPRQALLGGAGAPAVRLGARGLRFLLRAAQPVLRGPAGPSPR